MRLNLQHLTPREILIRKRLQARRKTERYNQRNAEKVKDRKRAYQAKQRRENPEKCNEAVRVSKAKKPEHYLKLIAEGKRRRYAADPAKHLEKSRIAKRKYKEAIRRGIDRWQAENRTVVLLSKRKSGKKAAESLTDHYIAKQLHLPVEFLREHLPNLIESKRQELLLKRQPKTKQNQ